MSQVRADAAVAASSSVAWPKTAKPDTSPSPSDDFGALVDSNAAAAADNASDASGLPLPAASDQKTGFQSPPSSNDNTRARGTSQSSREADSTTPQQSPTAAKTASGTSKKTVTGFKSKAPASDQAASGDQISGDGSTSTDAGSQNASAIIGTGVTTAVPVASVQQPVAVPGTGAVGTAQDGVSGVKADSAAQAAVTSAQLVATAEGAGVKTGTIGTASPGKSKTATGITLSGSDTKAATVATALEAKTEITVPGKTAAAVSDGSAAAGKSATDGKPTGAATVPAKTDADGAPQPAPVHAHQAAAVTPTSTSDLSSPATASPAAQQPLQTATLQNATQTPVAAQVQVALSANAPVPLNALAVNIALRAASGKSSFDIRLDPADLGRIDVRLDVDKHGQVTSHLTVEKPATLDLLRKDAPQLQRALEDSGLKTGDGGLQFSLRDQSSSGRQDDSSSSRNSQRLIITEDEPIPAVVASTNYSRALGSGSGVDISI